MCAVTWINPCMCILHDHRGLGWALDPPEKLIIFIPLAYIVIFQIVFFFSYLYFINSLVFTSLKQIFNECITINSSKIAEGWWILPWFSLYWFSLVTGPCCSLYRSFLLFLQFLSYHWFGFITVACFNWYQRQHTTCPDDSCHCGEHGWMDWNILALPMNISSISFGVGLNINELYQN